MALFGGKGKQEQAVPWVELRNIGQLNDIVQDSNTVPCILFKHSTRCSISSTALSRLERSWISDEMKEVNTYFLDLIAHRDISNAVESKFGIMHESPQVLVIKGGKCVYHNSHMNINYSDIRKQTLA